MAGETDVAPNGFLAIVFFASSLTIILSFGVNSPSVACSSFFASAGADVFLSFVFTASL